MSRSRDRGCRVGFGRTIGFVRQPRPLSVGVTHGGCMSWKRIGGIVCLVIAALLVVAAVSSLTRGDGPALNAGSGLGVSHAVGAFLPAVVMAILGLWLLK